MFPKQKKVYRYFCVLLFLIVVNFSFWSIRYFHFNQTNFINFFYFLNNLSSFFLGFYLFLISCFLFVDFILFLKFVFLKIKNKIFERQENINLKKRQFFYYFSCGTAAGLSTYAFYNAQKSPPLKKTIVPITDLHLDLENFNIVQLTDFHIGQSIGLKYVEDVVAKVNELNADLVVITGDLIDGFVSNLKNLVQPLKNIKSKYGICYVTGNHEYYWNVQEWTSYLQQLGFFYLENSHKMIQVKNASVLIGGTIDLSAQYLHKTHRTDVLKTIAHAPQNPQLKILLAHQPHTAFQAAALNYFHLQISGHTHGGQMWPGTWLVHLFQYFRPGLTLYKKMWVYVSTGTGYWGPPARLGTSSEITQLILKKKI
jgi:predicted MPP superfamily phosphohydrolase